MEENPQYDDNTPDITAKEAFQEEKAEQGSVNLNAIALYGYSSTFLVYIINLNFNLYNILVRAS